MREHSHPSLRESVSSMPLGSLQHEQERGNRLFWRLTYVVVTNAAKLAGSLAPSHEHGSSSFGVFFTRKRAARTQK